MALSASVALFLEAFWMVWVLTRGAVYFRSAFGTTLGTGGSLYLDELSSMDDEALRLSSEFVGFE